MMRKIFLLFAFALLMGAGFADTISDYVVPSSIQLGQSVTATGVFVSEADANVGQLCNFYFFDSDFVMVDRATSEYTTSTGRVALSNFAINEPTFKRDQNYVLRTECGDTFADANFAVLQREGLGRVGQQEFGFLTMDENISTILIWGFFFLVVLFVTGLIFFLIKMGRSK